MRILLVDPSLYGPAYDAELTHALVATGADATWATRPLRPGDRAEIPPERTDPFFYRRIERWSALPKRLRSMLKGCAHAMGLARLVWKVRREKPDVVHFLWAVVPLLDAAAMAVIRRRCVLVLTVHDTVPYNGERLPWPQRLGHDLPAKLAHRVIVHTAAGRETLARRGVASARLAVIPHGPLALSVPAPPPGPRDARWTMVLFGEIKPYKGLDVLIEAVAALPPEVRRRLRVVVAGRPRMDVAPLAARIAALGIDGEFELRLGRLSEEEMAALFAEADGFVFPYRQVDASGVYYLVSALGKWMIASRVGVFAEEDIDSAGRGALVPPEDPTALAKALAYAVERRPRGRAAPPAGSWSEIARATRELYERAQREADPPFALRQRPVAPR